MLDHRQLHVLQHGERTEQRTGLESDPVLRLDRAQFTIGEACEVGAEETHLATLRPVQAKDGAQQHALAGSRSADDAEHLAGDDRHVEAIVHGLRAETVDDAERFDRRSDSGLLADIPAHIPISMNSTANIALARITRKIACTTAMVVRRPSSREEPRTCMPR